MTIIPKQKFWMVYCVDSGPPTAKHQTKEDARAEAKRLARKVPDSVFVVLEAVEAIFKREFDIVTLREGHETYVNGLRVSGAHQIDDDEMPF